MIEHQTVADQSKKKLGGQQHTFLKNELFLFVFIVFVLFFNGLQEKMFVFFINFSSIIFFCFSGFYEFFVVFVFAHKNIPPVNCGLCEINNHRFNESIQSEDTYNKTQNGSNTIVDT